MSIFCANGAELFITDYKRIKQGEGIFVRGENEIVVIQLLKLTNCGNVLRNGDKQR